MSRIKGIRKSLYIKHMNVGLDLYKATINAASINKYGTVLNKVYHGPITKQGSSYLRWILTQVTWANIRKEPNGTVGNFYSKLKKKKGSAKASSKAKMLRIIYWVLKEHRPYQS